MLSHARGHILIGCCHACWCACVAPADVMWHCSFYAGVVWCVRRWVTEGDAHIDMPMVDDDACAACYARGMCEE